MIDIALSPCVGCEVLWALPKSQWSFWDLEEELVPWHLSPVFHGIHLLLLLRDTTTLNLRGFNLTSQMNDPGQIIYLSGPGFSHL
jgi:hypothetical protein